MVTSLQQPVLIRNTKLGPTVFQDEEGHQVTWQGRDDPMGEDIQPIPQAFLQSSEFLRSLSRGTFVLESASDDVTEALAGHLDSPALRKQAANWASKQASEKVSAIEVVDHKANADIVTVKCLGPATRGTGTCDVEIPVKEKGKNEHVPLCGQHEALAPQYVQTEDNNWVRVALAPRQQHQSIVS